MIAMTPPVGGANLAGVQENKALQQALKALAAKKQNSAFDPGRTDGVIDGTTINATLAVLQLVPLGISSTVKTGILVLAGFAMQMSPATEKALKDAIQSAASALAAAILAAAAFSSSPTPSGGGGGGATGPGGFPVGAIGRFHKSKKIWRIYAPGFSGVSGGGLGEAARDDRPPPGTQLVAESPTLPAGVKNGGTEDTVWWKRPTTWAIAGGAVALGTGTFLVLRR